MERVAITGANRGLGLEFARQYVAAGTHVVAACREPQAAQALTELEKSSGGRVTRVRLDVTDRDAIAGLADQIENTGSGKLDLLINNAGLSPRGERFENITAEGMLGVMHVNTVAPLLLMQALRPALQAARHPKVANISSSMGSLANKDYGRHYSYGASKAGLNMVTRAAACDLADAGISVVSLDPGWVQTDLGGANAALTPEESVRGMRSVIERITLEQSGSFLTWEGEPHPW